MISEKNYVSQILLEMKEAPRFSKWSIELIRNYLHNTVLEVGSGIGNNISELLLYCNQVIATDYDETYIPVLSDRFCHEPVEIHQWDITKKFNKKIQIDTIFCSNVLEHIEDEHTALKNIKQILKNDGNIILIVPQGKWLYSLIDQVVGHYRRYDKEDLRKILDQSELQIERLFSFNKIGVLGWFWQSKVRKAKTLGKGNLRVYNKLVPLFKLIDPFLPWSGLSLCVVAKSKTSTLSNPC